MPQRSPGLYSKQPVVSCRCASGSRLNPPGWASLYRNPAKKPCHRFQSARRQADCLGESVSHSRGGRLNLRVFTADGVETDYRLAEQIQIANFSFLPSRRFRTAIFWCFTEDSGCSDRCASVAASATHFQPVAFATGRLSRRGGGRGRQ